MRGRRSASQRRRAQSLRFAGTVQVDGNSIYYQTAGSSEGHRHTVVLIHGMAGTSECWHGQLEELSSQLYVVALDLPGHGLSEGWGATRIEEYADFLHRFLDTLGLHQRVVLAGHCLGAALALEYAARWPQRISGVVLAGIGMRLGIDPEAIESTRRGQWPAHFWQKQVSPVTPPEVEQRLRRDWLTTRPEVRYCDLMACADFHAAQVLGRVEAPALVVGGEADRITPPDSVRALWAALPSADIEILSGLGHIMMEEDPARFNEAVLRFLSSVHLPPRPVSRFL